MTGVQAFCCHPLEGDMGLQKPEVEEAFNSPNGVVSKLNVLILILPY